MADLIAMHERFIQVKGLLTDPEQTAFFFVTLPLSLPIAVVKRFIAMVRDYHIPIGGVIVNQVLERRVVTAEAEEYLQNRFAEQLGYMATIEQDLGPLVRAYNPLYEGEVVGLEMVKRVARDLFHFRPDF